MHRRLHGALGALAASTCLTLAVALPGAASAAPHRGHATARSTAADTTQCPWLDQSQSISTRVDELIAKMSLPDKVNLIEGHGSSNPYVFFEPAESQYCIPQLGEEDGPNGVGDGLTGVTQLPAGVNLAATFSNSLAHQYGAVVGSEELGKGAAVDLGPTINIDRDPRWGRSFEAFTEDPYLNGSLASAEVKGLQSTGDLDQLKHFAVYNQETNRNSPQDDAIVAERTLQEIYLKGFHTVVDAAQPASVMCSYATINGADACDNAALENGTLKTDWGFPGFITSDYGALHSTQGLLDGTDQEQPEAAPDYFSVLATNPTPAQLAAINTSLSRVFTEMFRFNLFNNPPTGTVNSPVTTPAHVHTATKVAEASATLLKNSGGTLPLKAAHGGTIAVVGPSADASPTYGGGGSARVIPADPVSPLTGLEAAAGRGTRLTYSQGLPTDASLPAVPASALTPALPTTGSSWSGTYTGTLTAPETGTYVFAVTNNCGCYNPAYLSVNGIQVLDNPGTPPQSVYSVAVPLTQGQTYTIGLTGPNYSAPGLTWATPSALAPGIAQAVSAAKAASTAVVVVSDDTETEAADRLGLSLPSAQDELISAVAAANPHTVVVVEAGAPVTMPWLSSVSSVLDTYYPGEVEGTALASVLFGNTDPSGHLPVTFPTGLSQVLTASAARFPGVNGQVQYSENLDVGYRAYDQNNVTPLFPFGYGLSYTSFRYSNLQVQKSPDGAAGDVTVSARVTNAGSQAGSDVAQVYLGDPTAAGEPPRQLAGYRRVTLAPGQSQRVTFSVTPTSEQWWDTAAQGWTTSPGTYKVYVGDSSATAQLPLQGTFALPRTPGARQVTVSAPATVSPGAPATVRVRLSASGTQTLNAVRLAVQLPDGWIAQPLGRTRFVDVAPGQALSARFQVVAPADSPNVNAVIHATATLGPGIVRESGATTQVK